MNYIVGFLFFCLCCLFSYILLFMNVTEREANYFSEKESNGSFNRKSRWFESTKDLIRTFEVEVDCTETPKNDNFVGNKSHVSDKSDNTVPLLTLFTTWRSEPEKYLCHNITLYNWNYLKPIIHPILFINETDVAGEASEKGWDVLPVSATRTEYHIPVLKNMYLDAMARDNFQSKFYAYANSDILFTNTIIDTLIAVLNSTLIDLSVPVMIIGRRCNVVDIQENETRTIKDIHLAARHRGQMFTSLGEDYFITTPNYPWADMPPVVVGRVAYDNWLVWNSKRLGHQTIDATGTLLAVHQTTKSGNGEGRRQPLRKFNSDMLKGEYTEFKYMAGRTSCADFATRHKMGKVIVVKRKLKDSCLP